MINLTTSHDPGDRYPGAGPYTHVAVTMVLRDDSGRKMLILSVAFGSDSEGSFVENTDGYSAASESFSGADYDTFRALVTNAAETVGDADDRCREQCLIDLGRYLGTLV